MKKISKKVSYIIVGILTLVAFLFDYLFSKEIIDVGLYLILTLIIMPALVYILYLFVKIERKCAYLHAVVSLMITYLGAFWSFWPILIYYENYLPETTDDWYATIGGIIIIAFVMHAVFWGLFYWITNYISKRKNMIIDR